MKRIQVRVVPKASRNMIKTENGLLKVYLTKPACDGQANQQLIELLADNLGCKKYQLKIVQGLSCRMKVIEVGC